MRVDENFDYKTFVEQSNLYQPDSIDLYSDVLSQIDSDSIKAIQLESEILAKLDKKRRNKTKLKSNSKQRRDLVRKIEHTKRKEQQRLDCLKRRGKCFILSQCLIQSWEQLLQI